MSEGPLDDRDLVLDVWITRIDDMQEEIRVERVLECRVKGIDEIMWEISDKPDRITQEKLLAVASIVSNPELAHRGREGREELVF